MLTLITEIEAVINDRPLTYVTDDSNDFEPLTPSHLVFGYRLTSLPPLENKHLKGVGDDFTPSNLRKRLKHKYHVIDCFRQRFKREYLCALRERTHSNKTKTEFASVSDVVLIKDNNPRLLWKMGRVVSLHPSKDGYVRSVTVKTITGNNLIRPVSLLYPVECKDVKLDSNDTNLDNVKPSRKAAKLARVLWQKQL